MMLKPVAKAVLKSAVSAVVVATTTTSPAAAPSQGGSGSSLSSSVLSSSLLWLRGGAGVIPMESDTFDLTRMRIRYEAFHSYNLVAAMLLGVAMALYNATPKRLDLSPNNNGNNNNKSSLWTLENIAKLIFNVTASVSIIGSAFATIVFTLLGAYGRTALGLDKQLASMAFLKQTAETRRTAFGAFVLALQNFNVSFCLSLFLNHSYTTNGNGNGNDAPQTVLPHLRWILSISAGMALFWCWLQWHYIISAAGNLVFSSPKK